MNKYVKSLIVLLITVVLAVIGYVLVFSKYDEIWFNFWPLFWLGIVTFVAGLGLLIAALLLERGR